MEPVSTPLKSKVRKEISGMRKITSELDAEVRKFEVNKLKLSKLEKTIATGNERIKQLTAQLSKHLA